MDSIAGQVVSTLGSSKLNEFRMQYAHRHQSSVRNSDSGNGPAVTVTGIASFGSPRSGTGQGNEGFDFKQNITQVIDNFTYIRAAHSYKFGVDYQRIHDERIAAPQFLYTFPSIASYNAAKSGANPFGYSSMTQITGDLNFAMDTHLYSTFVQDDWQIAPTVKVLYGLRYDLYHYPQGLVERAARRRRSAFKIDKNNFGPRVGVAWSVSPNTVVRASIGIMYDQPILGGYEQALQLSGSPKAPAYTFGPARQQARRRFRARFRAARCRSSRRGRCHPNSSRCAPSSSRTCSSSRRSAGTTPASVGFIYANGDNLPVVTDVNLITRFGSSPTGVRSTAEQSARRPGRSALQPHLRSAVDRRFDVQGPDAADVEATVEGPDLQHPVRRPGKGVDNTPLLTQLTVQAETGGGRIRAASIVTRVPNPLDMRHNLSGNIVYTTSSSSSNSCGSRAGSTATRSASCCSSTAACRSTSARTST